MYDYRIIVPVILSYIIYDIMWHIWHLLSKLGPYGYGSIPVDTIFSGMNIHLPAILMWTTGVQGFDTLPYGNPKELHKGGPVDAERVSRYWAHLKKFKEEAQRARSGL